MADKILYDTDVLIQNRDHLKADSAVFSEYNQKFIESMANALDSFNSDFATEMQKQLNSMKDTKAPTLQKNLTGYIKALDLAVTTMREEDQRLAGEKG